MLESKPNINREQAVDSSSFTILVVDDDDLVRTTVANLVSSLGYKSIEAESAERALEIIDENKNIDLVLTDVVMPGMDGLDLLKIIWESSEDIDVIVITGFADRVGYVDVVEAGAVDFIKKPISQRELDVKLDRVLREKTMSRQLARLEGRDNSTGFNKRATFSTKFTKELERAFRQNNPLHLAILEIAQKSEAHIADLAEVVKECIREEVDMAFRFDEREIAIVLPETTADQAAEIMQRLLVLALERGMGDASLAIGLVASSRPKDMPIEEVEKQIVEKAMQAAADSRADGGNTVTCWV